MPRSFSRSLRVHHALGDLLVLAEGAGLAQQLVDQRGLAVVDVGDDGDVADLCVGHADAFANSDSELAIGATSSPTSTGLSRRVGDQFAGLDVAACRGRRSGCGRRTRATLRGVGQRSPRRRRPRQERPASSASERDARGQSAQQRIDRQQARLRARASVERLERIQRDARRAASKRPVAVRRSASDARRSRAPRRCPRRACGCRCPCCS